ncbi:MAG: long-chain fatty acid--CoA ligase [Fimbriimonadaceae bacterium]|nr:long-chain fatty acid--CoA ligase [Fimbriimonadaceae bacterium]
MTGQLRARSLGDMLRDRCQEYADRTSHLVTAKGRDQATTYRELYDKVFEYARALDSLGLQKGDRLVILGESCFEWALTDWAALSLGVVTVPIYPTLPPDQATYIADDCGAKVSVLLESRLAPKLPGREAVYLRPSDGEPGLLDAAQGSGMDKAAWEARIDAVGLDDTATFIYTSGTTGQPKGAVLSHRNFVFLCENIKSSLPVDETDTFLVFLPLSHVYERFAGHILPVSVGARIVYAGSLASLAGDMVKHEPTVMLCVPRFLENMKSRILDGVEKQKPLQKWLFNLALEQGVARAKGKPAPLFGLTDALVGKKIRAKTGGHIKFFVSGGAALPTHVAEFYMAFGLLVLQGYGLTETTAASCLNHPDRSRYWTVGEPIQGVEVSLAGDGEILIRGQSVMSGYHNLPEATAEAIDAEGWFHTGDIGEWEDGRIKITDRKKDLLVLGNGKNVAPQAVENALKESPYINEVVLFGDGMEYCCALVVPDFDRLKTWLGQQGLKAADLAEAVTLPPVKELLKGEVDKANKKLADFEKVKKHVLLGRAFSVEGGELTPSLKVRRKVVKDLYADEVKSMQRG